MTAIGLATLVLRWIHILAAIALMGGTVFMRFALTPAAATLPDDARRQLGSAVRARWARVVMAAIALLLVGGLINYGLILRQYRVPPYYHTLFGIKFLLALVVFAIASLLAGRTGTAERMRERIGFWLSVSLLLATSIVCIAGVLRFAERVPKTVPHATRELWTPGEADDFWDG